VKAQKLVDDAITNMTLTPQEYSKYLEIAYKKEAIDKPKNTIGLTKSLPNAEMEQLILAHTVITDVDLRLLAENRTSPARN